MKWFKHFSDANTDEKLVSIRARFGLWGIGAYWILVELVCAQMQTQSPKKAEATFLPSELAASFGCKRHKLVSFIEHLRNIHGIKSSLEGELFIIEIPRLLKSLDNYHKNLQASSKSFTSVSTSGLVLESVGLGKIQELAPAEVDLRPSLSRKLSGKNGTLLDDIRKQYEEEKVF